VSAGASRGASRLLGIDPTRQSADRPEILLLKFEKNSPASFFEVEAMRRLPSWAMQAHPDWLLDQVDHIPFRVCCTPVHKLQNFGHCLVRDCRERAVASKRQLSD
jgi:hypothetical protein